MIRVVMVNYGGGARTLRSLEHLLDTDWPAQDLDIVLVDNPVDPSAGPGAPATDGNDEGDGDGVADLVERTMARVRVLRPDRNLGFAGGNNLALQDLGPAGDAGRRDQPIRGVDRGAGSTVDYVALVNNDVTVSPGWLEPLVATLGAEPSLGAACPKILLEDRFVELTVEAPTWTPGRGDHRALGVRLGGARHPGSRLALAVQHVSGFWGPEAGGQWTTERALLRLPEPQSLSVELRLGRPAPAPAPATVTVASGDVLTHLAVETDDRWGLVPVARARVDVINNAGSVILDGGFGADRGWLERDDGQYEAPVEVEAWCGAAVLLRADCLRAAGLFDERLFLYYEDLELSVRGARQGWRYRYEPASVVRHAHAATAVEGSPLSHYHNERNRLLVLARHEPAAALVRALGRYVAVTGSYARRDVAAPLLRGDRPDATVVAQRLRALGGFARLAPSMRRDRRER